MTLDFAKIEKEMSELLEVKRKREQLYDAKAFAYLSEMATPFVIYLRERLLPTAKLDIKPQKRNQVFTYSVTLLTAKQGNISTYNSIVNFGMLVQEDNGEFVWFVNDERVSNFEEMIRTVLYDCLSRGVIR